MKKIAIVLLFILVTLQLSGCGESLPKEHNYGNRNYTLTDETGEEVQFPLLIKGHIGVVGYIFTNCPDICPLTTNNMRLIRDEIQKEGITGVEFVSVSFDPLVDTPERLKSYADIRNIDTPDWHFLTGKQDEIDAFMKEAGILAVVGDSTVVSDEETIYYYVHTDRISLVDQDGFVRKDYKGSQIDVNEIVADIKKLGD